ncbi:acetyl-CoA C-acyltransferase [Sphingobacteriales bacterium UPWRP_1]|nr:acetyl-CoA acetyltransferase [Sphingobacteriales bacterium TSM_CSM]PSJ75217.1 acetyl-CoA C-acyltransferase [Sphingobacteriales bacterium UPWRP_1]
MKKNRIVLIDGCRTPFLRSGTDYMDLMSYELGQFAIKGLLDKTGLDPRHTDAVVMGTVISNLRTSNVAREAALTAGIPNTTPCHTVTMACISANRAIADGVYALMAQHAQMVIAGGVDTASDTPIGFTKAMRNKLFKAQKLKGTMDMLKFASSLRPSDFIPDKPAIAEYSTNRTMGQDCEILAAKYGVSRQEQDEFAVRSHQLAAKAAENGNLANEITGVAIPPAFMPIAKDNGIRPDTTYEGIAKLSPAFDRQFGTLTAANSSFLTDGAAAVLITTEEKALELGLTPKAVIVDFTFTGQDLEEELLLGPAYATAKLLAKTKFKPDDIDVFEFHEAFAGQILANLKCLASDEFAQQKLGLKKAVGQIPMDKFNLWGGSLSIGHPFGATGARLLTTAANRLIKENGKRALIAACAAGAHGHAMLIERYQAS